MTNATAIALAIAHVNAQDYPGADITPVALSVEVNPEDGFAVKVVSVQYAARGWVSTVGVYPDGRALVFMD